MPEGPEVKVIAQQWNPAVGKTLKKLDHTHNKKYKWERDGIPGWGKVGPGWKVLRVDVKGKLTRVDFYKGSERMSMLNTLGLEGFWSWDKSHKHRRVWFEFENGEKLFYVDSRNFGTIRFMDPDEADKKMDKIGWDLTVRAMPDPQWRALQTRKSLANKSVGEVLMKQNLFSGIGNIYKAEVLYDVRLNPNTKVEDVCPEKWTMINHTAHKILLESYLAKGSSVKSYNGGEFQRRLKIYKKLYCPEGHEVAFVEQAKRTTWYCPTCQV